MTDADSKQSGNVLNPRHFGSDQADILTLIRLRTYALAEDCALCSRPTFNRPLFITQLSLLFLMTRNELGIKILSITWISMAMVCMYWDGKWLASPGCVQ